LLLPILLAAIVLLANNKEIMGDYRNSVFYNILAWTITVTLSFLSFLLIAKTIADMF